MFFKKYGEAWRTIPEDIPKMWQESLSKRVQTVLKNKGGHTKYWLSSSLELYKLCYAWFNVFWVVCFLGNILYKEMRDGSRLYLHSMLYVEHKAFAVNGLNWNIPSDMTPMNRVTLKLSLTRSLSCCRSCRMSTSFSSTRDRRTLSVSSICSSIWSNSVSSAFCCSSCIRESFIWKNMAPKSFTTKTQLTPSARHRVRTLFNLIWRSGLKRHHKNLKQVVKPDWNPSAV